MKKGLRNVAIGIMVGTIVTGGAYILKKKSLDRESSLKQESFSELPDPTLEKVIHYNDGSMRFFFDFDERYNVDSEPYVEENEDEIDYIEIYNEDGTIEKVDYPTLDSSNNEDLSNDEVQKRKGWVEEMVDASGVLPLISLGVLPLINLISPSKSTKPKDMNMKKVKVPKNK